MNANPPPFPFRAVLLINLVYLIVIFPFKLAIPIDPPLDEQTLFVNVD